MKQNGRKPLSIANELGITYRTLLRYGRHEQAISGRIVAARFMQSKGCSLEEIMEATGVEIRNGHYYERRDVSKNSSNMGDVSK